MIFTVFMVKVVQDLSISLLNDCLPIQQRWLSDVNFKMFGIVGYLLSMSVVGHPRFRCTWHLNYSVETTLFYQVSVTFLVILAHMKGLFF